MIRLLPGVLSPRRRSVSSPLRSWVWNEHLMPLLRHLQYEVTVSCPMCDICWHKTQHGHSLQTRQNAAFLI